MLSTFRSIALRRFFFLIGTLYLYRCVTMYITTLPVPGMHMTCAPKVSSIHKSKKDVSFSPVFFMPALKKVILSVKDLILENDSELHQCLV